jgi:hypothetical protein
MDRRALRQEMCQRIERLPPALQYEDAYLHDDFWRTILAWEHEACRTIRSTWDFLPDDGAPDS